MNALALHLVRGAAAVALIVWGVLFGSTQPTLAIAAGVLSLVAMGGCPACWILGLCDTLLD